MGSRFHFLLVSDEPDLLDRLERRLHHLEAIWSRFISTSEISMINAAPDDYHIVSVETADLIERAIQGWALTGGVFDPTVLEAVVANGYDRTLSRCGNDRTPHSVGPALGCAGISVDRTSNLIHLGPGVGFDPGGIGKGLAADLLVGEALAAGASGAMVNIGGDLVCGGEAPTGRGWIIDVAEHAVSDERIALLAIESGAVVTSTTRKRRWNTGDGERHHLIDPTTGENGKGPVLVTVVAAEGWYGEVVAKHLIVGGDPTVIDTELAAAIVIDEDDGIIDRTTIGEMDRFLR